MNQTEEAAFGSLQTRVLHVEQSMATLSRDMRDGFALVGKQITEQSERFSQSQKPQWQAYSVVLTIALAFASFIWWVNTDRQNNLAALSSKADETLAATISKLADDKIGRSEFVLTQDRGKETRERINADILRGDSELQRQIDELKKQAMDTYSLRDVVVELKQNQKEMQEMVLRGRPNASP